MLNSISAIGAVEINKNLWGTHTAGNNSVSVTSIPAQSQNLSSIPTSTFLSQMPKVSFKGNENSVNDAEYPKVSSCKYDYDDLDHHTNSDLESIKLKLTKEAREAKKAGDLHKAAHLKLENARICRYQRAKLIREANEYKNNGMFDDVITLESKAAKFEGASHKLETTAHEFAMKLSKEGDSIKGPLLGAGIIRRMRNTLANQGNTIAAGLLNLTFTDLAEKAINSVEILERGKFAK